MRISNLFLWSTVIAVSTAGCYETNEESLDGSVVDATVPCEDGAEQDCVAQAGCLGTQVCTAGEYGECAAPDEVCDGVDNDCDGTIDEGFVGLGEACEDGEGKCTDQGRMVCAEDGMGTVCDAAPGDGSAEVCDGVDNDCDGEVDDDVEAGIECDTGRLGVCSVGATACTDGDTICEPTAEAADEICDGLDNDCDGNIDEGELGGPLMQPCYDGAEGTEGLGQCAAGTTVCTDGMWGACADQVLPGDEICDGVDNDCNGADDDTGGECVCTGGETQPCYTGPEGTEGTGACAGGIQTCAADGSAWGACEGETVPGVELCDGADNDCNGDVDDAPGVGGPCISGAGACEGAGELICDLESGQVVCDAEPGLPGDEICDGIDNDCDGVIDDVEGAGAVCEVGIGACLARGLQVCGEGGFECAAEEGAPSDEICDRIDNDCDGTVDNVEGVGEACEVGIGACRSTGVTVCSPEGVICGATEQDAAPAEYCGNGADDDCDGEADEPDCIIPCDGDDACGEGSICEDGACVPGDCRGDEDCLEGEELCEEGFCVPGNCRDDIECLDGEICDAGFCIVIPDACIDTPVIDAFGTIEGSTAEAPSQVTASCGSGARSPENAYDLQLGFDGTICIDTFGSAYDTVLHLRGECARSGSESHCNDDTGSLQSQLELEVAADGTYYVFVDGFGANSSGDYSLTVREGACGACTDDSHCPGDEFCAPQDLEGGACAPAGCGDGIREGGEQCDDGRNDDGDGCSARCEIEEGFDCVEAPAEIEPIPVDIDGRVNCGPTPANAAPVEGIVPWPAYRLYYEGGFVQISADGRKVFGITIAADGEIVATTPNLGVSVDAEEIARLYEGFASDTFGVEEGESIGAYFVDNPCVDNGGILNGSVRAVDFCFPTTCQASDDCLFGTICVGGECVEPVDSDGDGVSDDRDVDDDNDGIPDLIECFSDVEGPVQLANGSLEAPGVPAGANRVLNQAEVPGWSTTAADGAMELWGTGFLGVPAADGAVFAELNANVQGALYQDIATVPGTTFDVRFFHRGRSAVENMELRIGPPGETVQILTVATGVDDWQEYIASYTVPEGQGLTRFEFASLDAGSAGNFLDGVEFIPRCDDSADADGDGIPNSLDLDSDDDGILDADEAGHGLPHTDGVVDGEVGGNGLVDAAETAPDSGEINYEVADTDENGVLDFLEVGPFNCGNGALDDGEECDDGDREDGDGCNIDCVVEPDWECVQSEGGVGECGPGEPVETVSLAQGDFLPITGGEGGGPFDDPCAPGEVVTGFVMSIGPEWTGGQTFVQGSQAQCATLEVVDGSVVLTPTNLTPQRGQYAPDQVIACPEGAVVAGYIGYQAPRDDGQLAPFTFASAFGLVCGTPRIVDGRFVVEDIVDTDVLGDTDREFVGRFECPEGSLVGANAGRSGGIIDQLTVRCDTFSEACAFEAGVSVCEYQGECLDDADCEGGQLCRGNTCVQTGACPDDGSFGEPNDDSANATPVMEGRYEDLAVCGDDDWYTAELCPGGTLTIDVYFVDDDGDIDLAIDEGPSSTSTTDDEQAAITNDGDAPTTVSWRVYGFSGAENSYAMDVTVAGCVEACPDGRFPAGCPEDFIATDDRTCEAQEEAPAQLNGELLDICRGPLNAAYGSNGAVLPGGRVIGGGFFGEGPDGSRLNSVGVWACGPDGQTAGDAPINEAIGFAAGFELAEPGEYVIGLGADDNLIATVDGQEILRQNGAFQSWYMVPAVLSGGRHIITLEGVNTGGPGVFGAEIYGPFPPGSTANDDAMAALAYGDSVVFSSLEEIGGVFDTGENTGYSCPDGFSLDRSGDEPVCVRFERLDRCELLPDRCLADEDCPDSQVCIDGICAEPLDSDGDGVADIRDVDDDNDGIPDAAECFAAGEGQATVINGGFEEPPLPAGQARQTQEADVPGWETTEGPGSIEMWGTGFLGVPAAVGNAFAEVNAFEGDGALYQDVVTEPGTTFTWSFYHRGRGGPDELELRAGPPDAPVAIATAVTDVDAWRRYTGTYVVPEGQVLTRFEFRSILAVAGPGAGNFIDGVEFLPACPADADADGDGIPNSLDLDSDGDGMWDADEAGHGLPNTDGVVDGEVGGNGLADAAETVPDSGIINYGIADTDDNGVLDFLEVGPVPCGDGALDGGEECDDGNREDGDGCSIDCVVEPDWECVFNDEASVGRCAGDQPVETVSVTPGQNLPTIGGDGGGPFDDTCPPGEVVIGFDLSIGPWGGFPNDDFVTQSQAQCASFDVIDGEVVLTPTILTPLRGQTNNPVTTTRCPEGHVVSGYVGFDEGNAQRYVAGIGLVCSPVAVVDGRVEVGAPVLVDPVGNTGNEVGRFDCAPGQLVGANVGRSGGIIDQFTMRCDDIVEACRLEPGSVCEYQGECLDDVDCEDGQLCRGNVCVQTGSCPDDGGFGEPNDDAGSATEVMEGRYEDLALCGNSDFYTMELCPSGTLTVDVYFVDDISDIDLEEIPRGDFGTSVTDDEQIVVVNGDEARSVLWRIYDFGADGNGYAMDVTVEGCVLPTPCDDDVDCADGERCFELECVSDSDGDGDGVPDARDPDRDGDGVANGDEDATDPDDPDSDDDGICDGPATPDLDICDPALAQLGAGWNGSTCFTVDNTADGAEDLGAYQLRYELDTAALIAAGEMRADCGDLRVTTADGGVLEHWITDGSCDSAATGVWIKVVGLRAGEVRGLQFWWGNPAAESASDGEAVFAIFDDFGGDALDPNRWTFVGTGEVQVADGLLTGTGAVAFHSTTRVVRAGLDRLTFGTNAKSRAGTDVEVGAGRKTNDANIHWNQPAQEGLAFGAWAGTYVWASESPDIGNCAGSGDQASPRWTNAEGDDSFYEVSFSYEVADAGALGHLYTRDGGRFDYTFDGCTIPDVLPAHLMLSHSPNGFANQQIDYVFVHRFADAPPTVVADGEACVEVDPARAACEESCADLEQCFNTPPDPTCADLCMSSPENQAAGQCIADGLDPATGQCNPAVIGICGAP